MDANRDILFTREEWTESYILAYAKQQNFSHFLPALNLSIWVHSNKNMNGTAVNSHQASWVFSGEFTLIRQESAETEEEIANWH